MLRSLPRAEQEEGKEKASNFEMKRASVNVSISVGGKNLFMPRITAESK